MQDNTLKESVISKSISAAGKSLVIHEWKAARYLIILTPALNELIVELQISSFDKHAAIMKNTIQKFLMLK